MSKDVQQSPVEPLLLISNFFYSHKQCNQIFAFISCRKENNTLYRYSFCFSRVCTGIQYFSLDWKHTKQSKIWILKCAHSRRARGVQAAWFTPYRAHVCRCSSLADNVSFLFSSGTSWSLDVWSGWTSLRLCSPTWAVQIVSSCPAGGRSHLSCPCCSCWGSITGFPELVLQTCAHFSGLNEPKAAVQRNVLSNIWKITYT